MVKKLPAMQKTQLRSLVWEDPPEKEGVTHSVFLPEKSHGQRSLAGYSPWGHKESDTTEQISTHAHTGIYYIQTQSWAPGLLTPGGKDN